MVARGTGTATGTRAHGLTNTRLTGTPRAPHRLTVRNSSSSSSSSRSPAEKKTKKHKHNDIIRWYHKVSPLGTNNIMMIMTNRNNSAMMMMAL